MRIDKLKVWLFWPLLMLEVSVRFVVPALLCCLFILGAIADYDRRFANPKDHFTPTRAWLTIIILITTLSWIAYRFLSFVRQLRLRGKL